MATAAGISGSNDRDLVTGFGAFYGAALGLPAAVCAGGGAACVALVKPSIRQLQGGAKFDNKLHETAQLVLGY